MKSDFSPRAPSWYGVLVRALVATFVGTLLCFAVSLLLGIVGTIILSGIRGAHPNMTVAYRDIALPVALFAASIIFVLMLVMEIRHYRQTKSLSVIEKMSRPA